MAFNGSGVFNRLYNWAQDKANAVKIRADRMDAEMDGFATGLSNTICRDGQSTVIADIPMNGHKLTGLSAGASSGDSVRYEQVSERLAAEAAVASAATCNILGAPSERVVVTGTATITSFGSGAHKVRFVRFAGALTLTHNALSLILPGGANLATAAGDTCIVVSDASSHARVVMYQRADGMPAGATPFGRTLLGDASAQAAANTVLAGLADVTSAPDRLLVLEAGNIRRETVPNALRSIGQTKGQILWYNGANWVALNPP